MGTEVATSAVSVAAAVIMAVLAGSCRRDGAASAGGNVLLATPAAFGLMLQQSLRGSFAISAVLGVPYNEAASGHHASLAVAFASGVDFPRRNQGSMSPASPIVTVRC